MHSITRPAVNEDPFDLPYIYHHSRPVPIPLSSEPFQPHNAPNANINTVVPDMYNSLFTSFPDSPDLTLSYPYYMADGSYNAASPTPMQHSPQVGTISHLPEDVPSQPGWQPLTYYSNVGSNAELSEQCQKAAFPLSSVAHTSGHTHTMLPPMVHPNPDDPSMQFDSQTRTFNQRVANSGPSAADPYAAAFLQEQLGEEKWNIFTARLSERRLGQPKSKSRINSKSHPSDSKGATSIDFLVKVETVKEILRSYVPHPYNPLKSLSHPFAGSPTGSVTLTRSTILLLSGWSNTQFSYWARRAEAIAVLKQHDERLRAVGHALERRLRGEHSPATESPSSPTDSFFTWGDGLISQEDMHLGVTGKGLDIIIDEVKKRTGASQFIRGKHSSLDPYGSPTIVDTAESGLMHGDVANDGTSAGVLNATFQAMEYTHTPPESISPLSEKQRRYTGGRSRRASKTDSLLSQPGEESDFDTASASQSSYDSPLSHALSSSPYSRRMVSSSPVALTTHLPSSDPQSIDLSPKRRCVSPPCEGPLKKIKLQGSGAAVSRSL